MRGGAGREPRDAGMRPGLQDTPPKAMMEG